MTTPQIGASVASVLSQQELDTTRLDEIQDAQWEATTACIKSDFDD